MLEFGVGGKSLAAQGLGGLSSLCFTEFQATFSGMGSQILFLCKTT